MKAVAVFPGKAGSIHLADLPEPKVEDVPGGRGVLVEVLRVGVDGTDKEINDAEYGAAPEGYEVLVTGHESFGRVLEVGPNVRGIEPGDYVVATVRRPGSSIYDLIGTYDMTTDETYYQRGGEGDRAGLRDPTPPEGLAPGARSRRRRRNFGALGDANPPAARTGGY